MAKIINVPTFKDDRGTLSVLEKLLPFDIKRVYYIYNATDLRGGHRHKKTIQALISLGGACKIFVDNGEKEEFFLLDSPSKCLIVEPMDWHTMEFNPNAILLVLSSEYYDRNDYIDERYS